MNEFQLLDDLGRRAREKVKAEEDRLPAHWDDLAAGTLPNDEEEGLRAAAEEDEDARAAYELFRPLGEDFEERVVGELGGLVGKNVLPFSKKLRQRWWVPMVAAATLAGLAVGLYWLLQPASGPALPRFVLHPLGMSDQRSEVDPETPTFVRGLDFRVRLIPETRVSGPVDARFFVSRDDLWLAWDAEIRQVSTGALECEMDRDLALEPGTWTLVAAVGRPRSLPSSKQVRALFEGGESGPRDDSWQLLTELFRSGPGEGG